MGIGIIRDAVRKSFGPLTERWPFNAHVLQPRAVEVVNVRSAHARATQTPPAARVSGDKKLHRYRSSSTAGQVTSDVPTGGRSRERRPITSSEKN